MLETDENFIEVAVALWLPVSLVCGFPYEIVLEVTVIATGERM
jgi:hypothetical protein